MSLNLKHKKLKRPIQIVLGALAGILFVFLVQAASVHRNDTPVSSVQISIVNQTRADLLTDQELQTWIKNNSDFKMVGKLRADIDLKQVERLVNLHPWVASSQVFIDNQNILQIKVNERIPVARIFELAGNTFYMDSSGSKMPVLAGHGFDAPVFTNVVFVKNDSLNQLLINKINYLSQIILKDSFWNAQIAQVVVNPDQTFEMIPTMGNNQKIVFGDTTNSRDKLNNLFAFYQQVSENIGWDHYQVLDVRFKDQVVASPTLGITLPKKENPFEEDKIVETTDEMTTPVKQEPNNNEKN